jgi:SAM-dependent methyltransferase
VKKLSDRDLVAREYATVDRLVMRRLDRTAWLGGEHEPWILALAAIAEVRPTHILDAGCGSGDFAALLTAPDVRCVDLSPAAVDAAQATSTLTGRSTAHSRHRPAPIPSVRPGETSCSSPIDDSPHTLRSCGAIAAVNRRRTRPDLDATGGDQAPETTHLPETACW